MKHLSTSTRKVVGNFRQVSVESPYQDINVPLQTINQPLYEETANKSLHQSNVSVIANVAISDLHIQGHLQSGSFATLCQGTFQGQICVIKRPGMHFLNTIVALNPIRNMEKYN